MKFLVDMNLPPAWVVVLERSGFEARHWSDVGRCDATDAEIMAWAKSNGFVVFTHDLDYGKLLAISGSPGPSVIQLRTRKVIPDEVGKTVLLAIRKCTDVLEAGALITVDLDSTRVRVLPIGGE